MTRLLLVLALCLWGAGAQAADISPQKKALIDELLEISGATNMAEAMSAQFVEIMVQTTRQQNPSLSAETAAIIEDETNQVFYDNMIGNGWFRDMSYGLYSKYFTEAELSEMLTFYKTPTGRKATKVLPSLMEEAAVAGGAKGQSLAPIVMQRIQTRLAEAEAAKSPAIESTEDD